MKAINVLIFSILWGGVNAQVGFGTTSPSNDIDVESSSATATAVDINNTGGGDPKVNLQVGGVTTFSMGIDNSDADKFKIGTSALETNTRLTIDASGNVGIGTSSPSAKLDVIGANESIINAINLNCATFPSSVGDGSAITFGHSVTETGARIRNYATSTNAGHLILETNNGSGLTERIRILNSGNVGIGNTSPTALLDVDGSAIFNESGAAKNFRVESDNSTAMLYVDGTNDKVGIGTSTPTGRFEVYNTTQNDLTIYTSDGSGWISFVPNLGYISYNDISSDGDMGIIFSADNNAVAQANGFVIAPHNASGSAQGIKIMENGKVGIGTSSPGYLLTVNGQPGANGYTAFTNYSDSRLKTNISSLDTGALSKILQLRPVSFQYNQKYLQLYPNSDLQKVHKGFIAQEIRTVFPEMVSEMKTSPDSVQYLDLDVSHLQVYLVKAMQEQQAIINAQKKENDAQKAEIDALKQNALKVAELENKMNAMLLLLNNKQELTVKQ